MVHREARMLQEADHGVCQIVVVVRDDQIRRLEDRGDQTFHEEDHDARSLLQGDRDVQSLLQEDRE